MTARRGPRFWLPILLVGAGLVGLLLLPELADARVGGGQSFGRGGGGSGGGGGGGGGATDLVILLVHLCVRYPALGVPLTLIVIGFFIARSVYSRGDHHTVQRSHGRLPTTGAGAAGSRAGNRLLARGRPIPGLEGLREADPSFSMPVLLDYLVLVHRRAYEALANQQWDTLVPFVHPVAHDKLVEANPGVVGVSEVVVGGIGVLKVERRGDQDHLYVQFESSRLEALQSGAPRRMQVREQWTFRRAHGARTRDPEAVERLGCPNCGAAIEVTSMGACRNCDTPITAGQLEWQATFVRVTSRQPAVVPRVGWSQGGDESSVNVPILQDPDLAVRMRGLQARHPEFEPPAFGSRAELVYHQLQDAWSAGRWDQARPFVTDRMFQTLRFWMERYTRHGLRNQLEEVRLERVRIVKIEIDAWYEAITVRLWGAMKDSVVDRDGRVVGGNPNVARRFSEYWTFLRASGGSAGTRGDQPGCPSCGAPLDRISQTGVCGYCDSKITTGRFDWVLARIEQPEAYRG